MRENGDWERRSADGAPLEQYQDVWVKGRVDKKGVRECADRFEIIRRFCSRYRRPFTVLDLGSNLGYFSLRLTETFDCTSVAVEGVYAEWLAHVLEKNANDRVIFLERKMSLEDLRALAEVEHFDVVLALSVIHHIEAPFQESLSALRSLGDHLILELPFEANACGQAVVEEVRKAELPADATILGHGKSHLADGVRPILLLSAPKSTLTKGYIGSPRPDLALTITSTFEEKRVQFHNKPEARDWIRGINLQTYLQFGGRHPAPGRIASKIRATATGRRAHRDIEPWNVILKGDGIELIDADDPNHVYVYDDRVFKKRLLRLLRERNARGAEAPVTPSLRRTARRGPLTIAVDARIFEDPGPPARRAASRAAAQLRALSASEPEFRILLARNAPSGQNELGRHLGLPAAVETSLGALEAGEADLAFLPAPMACKDEIGPLLAKIPGDRSCAFVDDLDALVLGATSSGGTPDALDPGAILLRLRSLASGGCAFLTGTSFTRQRILAEAGRDGARVEVVGPAVEGPPEGVSLVPEAARRALAAVGVAEPYFLFTDPIEPARDFNTVMIAHAAVARSHPVKLVVFGELGPLGRYTRDRLCARGISDIVFIEHTPPFERQALRQGALAQISVPRADGEGRAVAEALAYGSPIIASRVGALPEIAGNAAIFLEPGDARGLAGAMEALVTLEPAKGGLRDRARRESERFAFAKQARLVARVFRRIAGAERRQATPRARRKAVLS